MRRLLLALCVLVSGCDGGSGTDAGAGDAGAPDAGAPAPVVETSLGPVEGERGIGYREFLGIPYARPPVGELRFAPPVPAEPWTEPRASVRPPRCVQSALGLELASQEDCLYLNVHTPDPAPTDAPVMVWLHGGAFIFGEGVQTDEGTKGDRLAAEHGVIVVSMNYRLGSFGFLTHPELSDALGGASGNFGLMDQQLALEWVRDNIAAFGGNPDDVTLFGESAGGMSVCAHLIAESSRGLFHRAITESGLCDTAFPTQARAEEVGTGFAEAAGCTTAGEVVSCLRARTVEELMAADASGASVLSELGSERSFWPSVDGAFLQEDFRGAVEGGRFADVPTIVGWNADEGTLFVLLAEQASETIDMTSYTEITQSLADQNGVSVDDVRAQYPVASYPSPADALAAALGHATLACPSRRAARLLAAAGADVRVYRFAYPDAGFQIPSDRELGAFHSAEIQFVFGHPSRIGQLQFRRAEEVALHEAMSTYWTDFARGDVDARAELAWPAYDLGSEMYLALDATISVGSMPDADACALWDAGRAP